MTCFDVRNQIRTNERRKNFMDSVIDAILGAIGTLIYPLFTIFFSLIDGLYGMFRSFAGIGDMNYGGGVGNTSSIPIHSGNSGALEDTGIVYYLVQSDIVKNMFLSILLLGLFLLIIFSVMAFIKNAYAAKPKTWQEIVGNAFRGLANFVVVPVCCLLGIWGGNILLNAIDGATKSNNVSDLSGQLFIAAAYNANEIRVQGDKEKLKNANDLLIDLTTEGGDEKKINDFEYDSSRSTDVEYVASKIDELYARGLHNKYSKGNNIEVAKYYSLIEINYIVLIAGGLFMSYIMLSLTYAMIRRLFIILMLFIISPAVNSYYPLDEGKAAGSWKSEFVKQITSAYGAVAGMNLFFSILPLMQNIKIPGAYGAILNAIGITELILVICGLLIVKEFISMISSYFGLENAYDKGTTMRKSVQGINKKITKGVATTGAFIGSTVAKGLGAKKEGKSFFASVGRTLRDSVIGKADETSDHPHLVRRGGLLNKLSKNAGFDVESGIDQIRKEYKSGSDSAKRQKDIKNLKDAQNDYESSLPLSQQRISQFERAIEQFKNAGDKVNAATYEGYLQKEKAEQAAKLEKIYNLISKLGLSDKVSEKTAKELKMSPEQLAQTVQNYKSLDTAQARLDRADKRKTEINDALTLFPGADWSADHWSKISDMFGFDKNTATSAKLDDLTVSNILKSGMKLSTNIGDVMAEHGVDRKEAINIASANMQINDAIEKVQKANGEYQQASQSYLSAVESANGNMYKSGGESIKLNEDSITKLEDALREGKTIEAEKIVKALMDEGEKAKKQEDEQAKSLSDISKLLADIKKKSEGK